MTIPSDEEIERLSSSGNESIRILASEVKRLRAGVREHQSATGHELCWLNDVALWRLLEKDAAYPHETLPVRDEFLNQCRCYYESRIADTPYAEPRAKQTVKKAK
jgi:hypothetical protein